MTSDKPSRRDLMKPVQLLGLAFGAALFAGIVTAVSMGVFQSPVVVLEPGDLTPQARALVVAAVVAGITFIVVLVSLALLILAVDPAQVTKTIDRPVLLEDEDDEGDSSTDASSPGDAEASGDLDRS